MSNLLTDETSTPLNVEQKQIEIVSYCDVCKVTEKQYKCPKCSIFTCSLQCCKQHKDQFSCSGKRDRTSYIATSKFSENDLRSDYHFLEDVLQSKDSAKRILVRDCGGNARQPYKKSRTQKKSVASVTTGILQRTAQNLDAYSKGVQNLVAAANERGVNMMLMPVGMSKRVNNRTMYDSQKKLFKWKVHIVFILSDTFDCKSLLKPDMDTHSQQLHMINDALACVTIDSVNDSKVLLELVNEFIDPAVGSSVERHLLKSLRIRKADMECMIQRIPSPANNPLFCKVSLLSTLGEALKGQTVLEYPTLFFGLAADMKAMRTLVCDIDEVPVEPAAAAASPNPKHVTKQKQQRQQKQQQTAPNKLNESLVTDKQNVSKTLTNSSIPPITTGTAQHHVKQPMPPLAIAPALGDSLNTAVWRPPLPPLPPPPITSRISTTVQASGAHVELKTASGIVSGGGSGSSIVSGGGSGSSGPAATKNSLLALLGDYGSDNDDNDDDCNETAIESNSSGDCISQSVSLTTAKQLDLNTVLGSVAATMTTIQSSLSSKDDTIDVVMDTTIEVDEEDVDDEGSDSEEEEEEDVFLQTLMEMEHKDIRSLQAIIDAEERKLGHHKE